MGSFSREQKREIAQLASQYGGGGGGGSGIENVVEDTSPQLGGTLDLNGQNISTGSETISPTELGRIDGVTSNVQTQLDGKAASSHTHTASDITDFDTEVSNNTDVVANTAKVSYTDAAKVATIETNADVTDTANVTAAGALMDSEVTNLADVKAFDTTDYATAAQGALADTATQPADIANFETSTQLNTRDTNNRSRTNHTGTQTASTISDFDTEVSNNASVVANTAKVSYTDSAKVAGIEANATADQSDAEIETAYNNQVAQVSSGERTAGTETAIRRFSPADVASMAGTHGGGGGGSTTYGISQSFFQVQDDGSTGQLTTGTAADLAGMWATPSITDATDFSWNGTTGILTVNTAGTITLDAKVNGWNNANNRHELHIQIYKNGTTVLVEDAQYASRNNTQGEGGAYIHGFKDEAEIGDTYRIRVFDIGVAVTIGAANVSGQTYLSATLSKTDSPGSWTSYTPTWAGSSTSPVIGDGSISASYTVIGDTCKVRLVTTMGSTTTYGSGYWTFTLPLTAAGTGFDNGMGIFYCNDGTSSSTQTVAFAYPITTTTMVFDVASGTRANVDFNSPHTWANGDRLIGQFEYKLA